MNYKINKIKNNIQYIGNCTDIFDEDTGECLLNIFKDVSDFANKEENFRTQIENGHDLFLSYKEFITIVGNYSFVKSDFEFYFYLGKMFKNIYVAYDIINDIHYFFY